jgi:hypothetical protein
MTALPAWRRPEPRTVCLASQAPRASLRLAPFALLRDAHSASQSSSLIGGPGRPWTRSPRTSSGSYAATCAGHDLLVAFSCKARAECPSCTGRHMASVAAHSVDRVLPAVPVRQWMLSLPFELRRLAAFRASACTAVEDAHRRRASVDQRDERGDNGSSE